LELLQNSLAVEDNVNFSIHLAPIINWMRKECSGTNRVLRWEPKKIAPWYTLRKEIWNYVVADNATKNDENLVLKLHISGKQYNNLWYNCNSYMQKRGHSRTKKRN